MPRSARIISTKLRTINPAPISSTSDRATSETINALLSRLWLPPLESLLPPALSASFRFVRIECHTGARPAMMPASMERPNVKARTVRLMPSLFHPGMNFEKPSGIPRARAATDQIETSSPSVPPSRPIKTLSVSACLIRRDRLEPKASLTAISRWREAARTNNRLATLAQAISSTKTTAPIRIGTPVRAPLTASSVRVTTLASRPAFVSGNCCCARCAIERMSDWACSIDTPGFSRPITLR